MTENMHIFAGVYETRAETNLGGLPQRESDIQSARTWVLHVKLPFDVSTRIYTQTVLNRLIAREQPVEVDGVIGYCGGDSWDEWCEPAKRDRALHIYFEAPAPLVAAMVGSAIAGLINRHGEYVISTAGDWSEQFS